MKTLKLIKCKAPYNSRAFLFNRYQKNYELLIAEMGLTQECLSDSPRDIGIMLFQELDFAYSYICSSL